MAQIFTLIASLLANILTIFKTPIAQKFAIFSFFYSILILFANFFIKLLLDNVDFTILSTARYLGVLEGLKVFIIVLLTGFISKQIIGFIRS